MDSFELRDDFMPILEKQGCAKVPPYGASVGVGVVNISTCFYQQYLGTLEFIKRELNVLHAYIFSEWYCVDTPRPVLFLFSFFI